MTNVHPLVREVYEQYHRFSAQDRHLCQWITNQAIIDELEHLVPRRPPPDENDDRPRTERPYLFNLPIEVREDAEGIHLERASESWHCGPDDGRPASGWHERGCPHIDWSLAE